MGGLEEPPACRQGAGEGSALVTEQLGLEERLGQRGAVDHDERPVGARARIVDGAREELLAGAGLALDQHGRVEGGHTRDLLVELHHPGRLADQVLEPVGRAQLPPVVEVLAGQAPRLERAAHDHCDLLHPERLGQVVVRAGAHRLDGRLDAGERREDHHREPRLGGAQALEDRETVEIGHAEIDERKVEGLALRQSQARLAAGDQAHAIPLAPEHLGQQLTGHRVVVGDEQRLGHAHPKSSSIARPERIRFSHVNPEAVIGGGPPAPT